jgi:MFS family permease
VLYALAALALAHVQSVAFLAVAMLATGVAWIAILSALQVSAQMTLPPWVRARGLAAFVVIFMGGMAFGSIFWGQVATRIGIPGALTAAAGGMVVAIALTWKYKLGDHQVLDFTPTMDWPLAGRCRDSRARRARDGDDPVPDPVPTARRIRRAMQAVREMRPAQRRVLLAARPRRPRIRRSFRRSVHGRIVGSSICAARARQSSPTGTFSATARRRFSRRRVPRSQSSHWSEIASSNRNHGSSAECAGSRRAHASS